MYRSRIIIVNNKRSLIVAIKCCVGDYIGKTTILFGNHTKFVFKRGGITEKEYDDKLRSIIKKLKRTKL